MKRMFFREVAILLVLALLAPMFSVAEGGNVELPDDVSEPEQALGLEGFEAADAVEIEAGETLTLDGLPGELSGGEPEGLDAGAETGANMQFNEAENAAKKYGVPAALTLGVKETFALKCTKKKLTYKTSSAKIAKVDAKGVVTAVKKGKATITVYSNKKKLTTCKVTVVAAPKKVTLDKKSAVLGVKEKLTLMPQVTKNSHTSFTYTVKNNKIATVSKTGVVTGKKAGKTTVTVKTHNGKKATLKLTVKKAPGKVTMSQKAAELQLGDSLKLKASLPKGQASEITWKSSNTNIAYVDQDGHVTALSEGSATITASTYNGKKGKCRVKVTGYPQAGTAQGNLEMALQVLEKLDENPESIGVEEMTFEELPTEGIEDKVFLKEVKTFNTAQKKLEKEMGGFLDDMAQMGKQCDELYSAIADAGLVPTENKLVMKGMNFTVDLTNMEYMAEDAEILSVVTSEDESSIAIRIRSNGREFAIVSDSKGLRVLDGNAANMVFSSHNKAVTANAFAAQNGLWSSFCDAYVKGIDIIQMAVGTINEVVNDCVDKAQAAYDSAVKASNSSKRLWDIRRANPDNPNMQLISPQRVVMSTFNLNKAEKVLISARKCKSVLGITALKGTLEKLKDIGEKNRDLVNIMTHGHITDEEREDPALYETAVELLKRLASAEISLGTNAALAFIELAAEINDLLTLVKLLLGPAGMAAGLVSLVSIKGLKKLIVAALKQAGVDIAVSSTAESFYKETLEWDKKLHEMEKYGIVSGIVSDKDTGKPLADVSVSCGTGGIVTTDESGRYILQHVHLGVRKISFAKEGFTGVTKTVTVESETRVDAELLRRTGTVKGTVFSLSSKVYLSGVKVSCPGCSPVTSDELGGYTLVKVPEGENEITFVKDGYIEAKKKASVGENETTSMDVYLERRTGTLTGTVRDAATNSPLSGVSVSCTGIATAITDASGKYTLDSIPEGTRQIGFAKEGYGSKTETVDVKGATSRDVLLARNTGSVMGTVYDKSNDAPLSGVSVSCVGCDTVITDIAGEYVLKKVPEGEVSITFAKEGYSTQTETAQVKGDTKLNVSMTSEIRNGSVSGKVYENDAYGPLGGVSVVCQGCEEVITDSDGGYTIGNVAEGKAEISFVREGYIAVNITVDVLAGEDTPLNIYMIPDEPGIPIDKEHFPDDTFREIVSKNYDYDGNKELAGSERYVYGMDISQFEGRENIRSLKGIEYLKLHELKCINAKVTDLDVSGCTTLRYLYCYEGELTNLNCSGCTNLFVLYCYDNQLTTLNVSGCAELDSVRCFGNKLTSLDFSSCPKLCELYCGSNELTSINLKGCYEVVQVYCTGNKLTELDVSNFSRLIDLQCIGNNISTLNISGCPSLQYIDCSGNKLSSLNVGSYANLRLLYCGANELSSLNISNCTALEELECGSNKLSSLDVSGFSKITKLYCAQNRLTSLKVNGCTRLKHLSCTHNQLSSLDVRSCPQLESCTFDDKTTVLGWPR